MSAVTYGVIGCGGHATQGHIVPARQAGMRLVGVYDPDPERARQAGAAVYDSVDALLAADVDAVVVTSPDRFHPDQLLAAVKAGLHVLVDKPLAVDRYGLALVAEALRLADGLVVSGCHPRRFDPPYAEIRRQLPDLVAEHGRLLRVEMDFSYHAPAAAWKHTRSLLLDHFPHEVDTLRWWLGDTTIAARRLVDGPDRYEVAGVTGAGVTFLLAGTRRLQARVYPEQVRLRFDRADMAVNARLGSASVYNHGADAVTTSPWSKTDYDVRAAGVMADFAAAVRGAAGYLTAADLWVNTESAIALAEDGVYEYRAGGED